MTIVLGSQYVEETICLEGGQLKVGKNLLHIAMEPWKAVDYALL